MDFYDEEDETLVTEGEFIDEPAPVPLMEQGLSDGPLQEPTFSDDPGELVTDGEVTGDGPYQDVASAVSDVRDTLAQVYAGLSDSGTGEAGVIPDTDNRPTTGGAEAADYLRRYGAGASVAAAPRAIAEHVGRRGAGQSIADAVSAAPDFFSQLGAPPLSREPQAAPQGGVLADAANTIGSTIQGWGSGIASYFLRSDAALPTEVKTAEQAVDPQGLLDPDARKLLAVSAAKSQDEDQARKLVQAYAARYDAYRGFAAAALQGTDAKPGDPVAAAKAATQAFSNVLDGTKTVFTPAQGGFTATVTRGGETRSVPLSAEQFRNLMVGPSSLFDQVMAGGSEQALAAAAQGVPQGDTPSGAQGASLTPPVSQYRSYTPEQRAEALGPGSASQAASAPQANVVDPYAGVPPEIQRRAMSLFPWARMERERANYIAQAMEKQADRESLERRAYTGAEARTAAQENRGNSAVAVQQLRNEGNMGVAQERNRGATERNQLTNATRQANARNQQLSAQQIAYQRQIQETMSDMLAANPRLSRRPEELLKAIEPLAKRLGMSPVDVLAINAGANGLPAPGQQTPAQARQGDTYPTAPRDVGSRKVGQVYSYVRDGKPILVRWNGKTWDVVDR